MPNSSLRTSADTKGLGVSPLPHARNIANPGDITFLIEVARRRWRTITAAGAIGLLLGSLHFLVATPLYGASSRILIDFRRLSPIGENELLINFRVNDAAVDSQTTIIMSEGLMRAVIGRLKLHEDPEFIGAATWWRSLLGFVGLVDDPTTMTENARIRAAMELFAKRLKAQRVITSYVLEVSFSSQDPSKAVAIVDEVAAAYVRDQLAAKQDVASNANDWFTARVQTLHDQVAQAQNAAVEYRRKNQVMLAVGKFVDEQQVADLSARLIAARNDRAQAESKLARIDEMIKAVRVNGRLDGAVADVFKNDVINALRQKYFDMSRHAAEVAGRFGESHEAVIRARANMKEVEKSIDEEVGRIAQSYRSDAAIAKAQEEALVRSLDEVVATSATAQKARVELAQLDSMAQNFQTIRDNFLARLTEVSQEQSFPITEARVLNKASLPEKPASPRASMSLIGGTGGGLGIGFAIALSLQIFSRRARTREFVEMVTGAPCLAYLPNLDETSKTWRLSRPISELLRPKSAVRAERPGGQDSLYVTTEQPFGLFAEGERGIKIALGSRLDGRSGVVIGIASALPGEGSSTVAANLAGVIAASGQRVILIDADLRRRSLSRRIVPNARVGLQSVYQDLSRLLTALSVIKSGAHFLPSVDAERLVHPAELLGSSAMRNLLDLLRRTFDYVVVDLPPIIPLIDGRSIAHLLDGYVLVVEWNRTTLETLGEAMAVNPQIAEKLVGFAFNKVDIETATRIGDFAAVADRGYFERTPRPVVAEQPSARIA